MMGRNVIPVVGMGRAPGSVVALENQWRYPRAAAYNVSLTVTASPANKLRKT